MSQTQRYKILLVDDEPGIRESLRAFLERYLFEVYEAATGEEGLELLDTQNIDLVLLDMMLPDMHGIEICKRVKAKHYRIPIIFLTGVTDATETVLGFEAGADDYVEKPFNPHVLLARVRAKLKQLHEPKVPAGIRAFGDVNIDDFNSIEFGRWIFYPKKSLITHPEHDEAFLTDKENALMKLLLSDPSKTFTREDIATYLNLASHMDIARDVNIHIHRLRAKLTQNHNSISPIKSVRSQGYTLDSYLIYTYDGKQLNTV